MLNSERRDGRREENKERGGLMKRKRKKGKEMREKVREDAVRSSSWSKNQPWRPLLSTDCPTHALSVGCPAHPQSDVFLLCLQCSVTCGVGFQRRKQVCQRLTAKGRRVPLSETLCRGLPGLPLVRPCQMPVCSSKWAAASMLQPLPLPFQPSAYLSSGWSNPSKAPTCFQRWILESGSPRKSFQGSPF